MMLKSCFLLLPVLGLLGCANERLDTHPVTPEAPVQAELAAIVRSADVVAVLAIRKMEHAHIPDSYTVEKVFTGTIRRSFRLPERFAVGGELTFGYVQFSRTDVNETYVEGGWPFTDSGPYLVALRRWNQADFGPVPNETIQAGWKPTAAYTFVSPEKTCWWPADSQEARFVGAIIAQQSGADAPL